MQAIRNKFHSKGKRQSKKDISTFDNTTVSSGPVQDPSILPVPSTSNGVVTSFVESHEDIGGRHVDQYQKTEVSVTPGTVADSSLPMESSIPLPPPPPPADFWKAGSSSRYDAIFRDAEYAAPLESSRSFQTLPVEVIEKPIVVHESIRTELVEEIQPVVEVQREKTEIRQITQPLVDKEIKPVLIEERILPVEILPTITRDVGIMPERFEESTRTFDATKRQIIEKTAIVQESEKWRIIEEVQPIIYREIVVPHIIRTSRPMYETIVAAPVFVDRTMNSRGLTIAERERWSSLFNQQSSSRAVMPESSVPILDIMEPTEIRVAPVAPMVHEKKEVIEETVMTTTTTTVAPVIGADRASRRSMKKSSKAASMSTSSLVDPNFTTSTHSLSASGIPEVVQETHDVKVGNHGEKVITDSITTHSHAQNIMPTRAN